MKLASIMPRRCLRLPNGETYSQTLFTTPKQEALRPLLDALKIDPNEQGNA